MATTHLQSIWVHGHSMQVEDNDALAAVWRSGFCLYVEGKPDSLNWLHASSQPRRSSGIIGRASVRL